MNDDLAPPDGDPDVLLASAQALRSAAGRLHAARHDGLGLVAEGGRSWRGERCTEFDLAGRACLGALDVPERHAAEVATALSDLARRHRDTDDEVAGLRRRAASDPSFRPACEQEARAAKDDLARYAASVAARIGERTVRAPTLPLGTRVALNLGGRAPALVGGLDGLPASVRDRANRQQLTAVAADLRRRLARLSAQRHAYEPYGRGLSGPDREIGYLEQKLEALATLRRVLALPHRQLLLLDADSGHQLHAVVAVGDLDTARDIAVFTPGLASNVQDTLARYDDAMVALRERSGPATTATVTWLGYDAPQDDDVLTGWLSVGSAHLARQGGDGLAAFLRGLRAARGPGLHLTALGHSYGSTTTGYALEQLEPGIVDDVVLFGSPGMAAHDVRDLHVPAGHLWDLNAAGDLVAALHRFGDLPPRTPGFQVLDTDAHHGLAGVGGHGHYLDPGTTSQFNIAAIVSGHPENAVLAPPTSQPGHLAALP